MPGALDDVHAGDHKRRDVTLGDAKDKFVDDSAKAIGRTRSQVLRSIQDFDIAGSLSQGRVWPSDQPQRQGLGSVNFGTLRK
tara:strand:- start:3947 stop:4192 length:246 start_codon:yes stop_codon:yes gene_type:complete